MTQKSKLLTIAAPLLFLACAGSGGGGGADDLPSLPDLPAPEECVVLADQPSTCGYLALEWDIEGQALSCDDVSAGEVRVEITPAGSDPREINFDCNAGSGLTLPLEQGPYSLRMHLIAQDGAGLLASSQAETISLPGNERVYDFSVSFRLADTVGRARYGAACNAVGDAFCDRLTACGIPCNDYEDFVDDCCEGGDDCDEISPLTDTQVSSCSQTLDSISCAYLDSALYGDLADLSFCEEEPPAPITAADVGKTCGNGLACPAGYTCLMGEFSDLGFCSLPCDGESDTTTCSNAFPGPGVAACGIPVSGTFFCGVLCGENNNGNQSCPGMLECEDGYDNDIEPDTCLPQ